MRKKLKSTVFLLCISSVIYAQNVSDGEKSMQQDNSSFTFTESQLGEDDDASQNVIVINSNNNIYTNDVGYRFSQARFKYRAYQSFYQDTYINGAKVNDLESGQFRYSNIGGLNDMVRSVEFASPFESNNFSMPGIGGSNNYDFRASHYATGSKATLSACNRNYTARAMYSFGTGLQKNGWAFAGMASYRWADEGNVEGTFYNSLGYFLSAEKVINDAHSISFATWGNPTERAAQGASTDEAYWLANDNQYNPYWGYQNGKKRNSRITSSYEPSAVITWDWNIDKTTKLITTLTGKYSIYSSTKLNYNGTSNPAPDYWKNMPSSLYDVWDATDKTYRTDLCLSDWQESYNYWKSSKANRQINWDKLYFANQQINAVGGDAGYYVQAKHINNLAFNFSSTLQKDIDNNSKVNMGINLGTNKGMHYQTMEDLLGADSYHNINTYALGTYSSMDDRVQYDLNHRDAEVKVGDRFGYDYNLYEQKAEAWVQYIYDRGHFHTFVTGKIDGTQMYREGNMRNGLSPNNSYGKSGTAHFMGGGGKIGTTYNLGSGNVITLGVGYEQRAPLARNSFAAPEINNNFVSNLKTEEAISAELGYALDCPWLKANITGYYTHIGHATEWQNYYYDDINSFTYVSLTNIQKAYTGNDAIKMCAEKSWAGFKAEWIVGERNEADTRKIKPANKLKVIE